MSTTVTSTDSSTWTSLQTLIAAADANGDGTVSETELVSAVTDESSSVASAIVTAADSDGDGAVSLMEFSSFADTFSSATGMALLSAQEQSSAVVSFFTGLDSDGSATLDSDELTAGLTATEDSSETEVTVTEEEETSESEDTYTVSDEVQALLDAIDTNGDGAFDKSDVALRVLEAAGEAESKNDDDLTSSLVTTLDANGDGTLSDEELQAAGLA
ncbi:EF-hand domain-containing protein [Magnetospirillum aberrantis]|nr:EF-hand domain-containing protein [Magnetospirillum aberrantis]